MQCEVDDLYESLRGFGGGYPSDSEPDSPPAPEATAAAAAEREGQGGEAAAEGKPDLLGLDVWPAALELCSYLAAHQALVRGATVLELGAGVGLPALLAAQMGASRVVLTDYEPQVMCHVERNAALCGVADRCAGLVLDWTRLGVLPAAHRGAYSLLLAADVLYIQDIMPGFVEATSMLLAPGGVMVVGHQTRRAIVLDADGTPVTLDDDVSFGRFKELCAAAGLRLRQLGSRESPGFPGPLLMLGVAREEAALAPLPAAFQPAPAPAAKALLT